MKIIFMGTPDFGVPVLREIVECGHDICAVVTQPDRPKGRGKGVAISPVKEEALKLGIPVFQPEKVKSPDAVAHLRSLKPDLIVVVAFGQILSQEILDIPRYGCVNVHASLLPKYRGAAPIQKAILDGEKTTGITTMLMDKGLDTGDILLQEAVEISDDETGGSLFMKLSHVGARLLTETLKRLEDGSVTPVPQRGESSYAGMLDKTMGLVDWEQDASVIERQIRAMNPWPSAYTYYEGRLLKLWKAEILDIDGDIPDHDIEGGAPGTVISAESSGIDVLTGNGILRILELQPEGKKRMETASFLRGHKMPEGSVLGER
jgi:methionyl-tRNA formyltransferase